MVREKDWLSQIYMKQQLCWMDKTLLQTGCKQNSDLPLLPETYDLVSADELKQIVERKKVMLGYDHGRLIGFVGEHLEGSMGLLYVFHKFRRKGYGAALEKSMIAKTLEEGYIPFGQVEKNNHASMQLHKKIGMTTSEQLICWMWKPCFSGTIAASHIFRELYPKESSGKYGTISAIRTEDA